MPAAAVAALGGLVGGEGALAEEGYAAQGKDPEEACDMGVKRFLNAFAGLGAAGNDVQGDNYCCGGDEGHENDDEHFHFANLHSYLFGFCLCRSDAAGAVIHYGGLKGSAAPGVKAAEELVELKPQGLDAGPALPR